MRHDSVQVVLLPSPSTAADAIAPVNEATILDQFELNSQDTLDFLDVAMSLVAQHAELALPGQQVEGFEWRSAEGEWLKLHPASLGSAVSFASEAMDGDGELRVRAILADASQHSSEADTEGENCPLNSAEANHFAPGGKAGLRKDSKELGWPVATSPPRPTARRRLACRGQRGGLTRVAGCGETSPPLAAEKGIRLIATAARAL